MARNRANQINVDIEKSNNQELLLRAYACEKCNEFHLTKRPSSVQKKRERSIKSKNTNNENYLKSTESRYWNKKIGLDNE